MSPDNHSRPESTPLSKSPVSPSEGSFRPTPALVTTGESGSHPKSKLIAVVLTIVTVVIALVISAWLAYPTILADNGRDKLEAWKTTNIVQAKLSDLYDKVDAVSYVSSDSTEAQINNRIADLQLGIDAYKSEAAKLTTLKAITQDTEAKKLYDTYKGKSDAYLKYSKALVDSKTGMLAIATCDDIDVQTGKIMDTYTTAVQNCKIALSTAGEKNENIKKIVEAYKVYVKAAETYTEGMSALSKYEPNYDQKSKALSYDLSNAATVLQQVKEDAHANLKVAYREANPGSALLEVSSYLAKAQK